MRAAVYYKNSDVRLEERPKPSIGPGEMLVKVMACGICGSDVLEWYRVKKAPIVLGHEMSGVVAEIGEGAPNYKVGDRVFVTHHVPCNTCHYCLAGNHTVCETLHTTNFHPGAFSEFIRVPKINVDRGTFILPPEMSFEEGTFIEPLGCVIRGQRVARFKQGQSLLVIGSGISGLLHIMLARASGAGRIIATDVSEFKLELARKFGADVVIRAKEDVPAITRENNEGRGADLVMVCTGAFPAFQQGLKSVDRAGTVMTFATTEPGVDLPVPINEFWRNSVTVMSSYAAAPYDLGVALELIRAGRINVKPMITHRFGLAETGAGFKMMTSPTERALKIIIEPQR